MALPRNVEQIFVDNPVTTLGASDLIYLSVGGTTDGAMAGSSLLAQIKDFAIDTGVANTLAITLPVAPTPTNGDIIYVKPAHNNTAASTLAINGGATKNIDTINGALLGGELQSAFVYQFMFSTTANAWVITNPSTIVKTTTVSSQVLLSIAKGNPTWSAMAYPSSVPSNSLLFASSGTAVTGITPAADGVLISNGTNVPSWLAAGTTGQVLTATTGAPPSWQAGGGGSSPITAGSGTNSAMGGDGTETASGNFSFAYGNGSTSAGGLNSFAFGNGASASGTNNIAMGQTTIANGTSSVAIGDTSATTTGKVGQFAIGFGTTVNGNSGYAFGHSCTVNINGGIAIGNQATANGSNSIALGFGATATNGGSWVLSDQNEGSFSDTGANQFVAGFNGGYFYYIATASTPALALRLDNAGNLSVVQAGTGLRVAEGTNAKQGIATLTTGLATVSNTSVTANSRIFLTAQDNNSIGALRVTGLTAGTGFVIASSAGTDSGVVAYQIFEPS